MDRLRPSLALALALAVSAQAAQPVAPAAQCGTAYLLPVRSLAGLLRFRVAEHGAAPTEIRSGDRLLTLRPFTNEYALDGRPVACRTPSVDDRLGPSKDELYVPADLLMQLAGARCRLMRRAADPSRAGRASYVLAVSAHGEWTDLPVALVVGSVPLDIEGDGVSETAFAVGTPAGVPGRPRAAIYVAAGGRLVDSWPFRSGAGLRRMEARDVNGDGLPELLLEQEQVSKPGVVTRSLAVYRWTHGQRTELTDPAQPLTYPTTGGFGVISDGAAKPARLLCYGWLSRRGGADFQSALYELGNRSRYHRAAEARTSRTWRAPTATAIRGAVGELAHRLHVPPPAEPPAAGSFALRCPASPPPILPRTGRFGYLMDIHAYERQPGVGHVSLRDVADLSGASIALQDGKLVCDGQGIAVTAAVGSQAVVIHGRRVELDRPVVLEAGATLIPARLAEVGFGLTVRYQKAFAGVFVPNLQLSSGGRDLGRAIIHHAPPPTVQRILTDLDHDWQKDELHRPIRRGVNTFPSVDATYRDYASVGSVWLNDEGKFDSGWFTIVRLDRGRWRLEADGQDWEFPGFPVPKEVMRGLHYHD